jgi:hypothetical protein
MWKSLRCVALGVAVAAAGAAAATASPPVAEPLVTDRPDITESSRVVARASLQIETSVLWRRSEADAAETDILSTPTLFRFGIGRSLELRLAAAYAELRETMAATETSRSSGVAPFVVGAKLHLTGEAKLSMGLIAFAEVPSGTSTFKTRYVTAGVLLAADGDLSERVAMGVNAGLTVLDDDGIDPRGAGAFSTSVGLSLSERAGGFAEIAVGGIGLGKDDRFVLADAGVTLLLSPDLQLDTAFGGGLTERSDPDFFATLGFSCRMSLARR